MTARDSYLEHALGERARAARGVRLEMEGRIKVGRWLRFKASWVGDGRSFEWRARAGVGPLRPLSVVDRCAEGAGGMDVRLLGRVPLVRAHDEDTVRSAAGRTAIEAAVWAPMALQADRGVTWRDGGDELVATWPVPPETPEVRLRIDANGAVRSVSMQRWDNGQHGRHGYIPFGAEVTAERSFGDLTIASQLVVGWWFGTPDWDPFFEARVIGASLIP